MNFKSFDMGIKKIGYYFKSDIYLEVSVEISFVHEGNLCWN